MCETVGRQKRYIAEMAVGVQYLLPRRDGLGHADLSPFTAGDNVNVCIHRMTKHDTQPIL